MYTNCIRWKQVHLSNAAFFKQINVFLGKLVTLRYEYTVNVVHYIVEKWSIYARISTVFLNIECSLKIYHVHTQDVLTSRASVFFMWWKTKSNLLEFKQIRCKLKNISKLPNILTVEQVFYSVYGGIRRHLVCIWIIAHMNSLFLHVTVFSR